MQWIETMKGSLGRLNDRRRAQRLAHPAILAFYSAGTEPAPHRIRDVSRTGAYMYTVERWYPGTLLQVTLDIDPGEVEVESSAKDVSSITLWSRIVRHGDDGVGMEFVLVQKKRRDSMHKFLAGVKSRSYETSQS
jgi:hypothetical protein